MQKTTKYNLNIIEPLVDNIDPEAINENTGIIDEALAPTYTEASTLTNLTSGEKLSVALGKIKKAITDYIAHKNAANPHSGSFPASGGTFTGDISINKSDPTVSLSRTGAESDETTITKYAYNGSGDISGTMITDQSPDGFVSLVIDSGKSGKDCYSVYRGGQRFALYTGENPPYIVGTYVGDGAAEKTISLGFTPTALYTCHQNGGTSYFEDAVRITYGGLALPGQPVVVSAGVYATEITAGGFKAMNEANLSGNSYHYIAFK